VISRKAFIEHHGGTCANWTWSWSFVNHSTRTVFFGAWDEHENGDQQTILHEDWRFRSGRKAPGYVQALEHIRLVEGGYALMTFPMERGLAHEGTNKDTSKIKSFKPVLEQRRLRRAGKRWIAVAGPFSNDVSDGTDGSIGMYLEGKLKSTRTISHERNADARAKCLALKGYDCAACGMNFGKRYGAIANNFIHVHHVNPISRCNGEYQIHPDDELVPLCPNCHSVAHMRAPEPFSVEEIKAMLGKKV
jgi:5-methylcytosine-specific restriction protein A